MAFIQEEDCLQTKWALEGAWAWQSVPSVVSLSVSFVVVFIVRVDVAVPLIDLRTDVCPKIRPIIKLVLPLSRCTCTTQRENANKAKEQQKIEPPAPQQQQRL